MRPINARSRRSISRDGSKLSKGCAICSGERAGGFPGAAADRLAFDFPGRIVGHSAATDHVSKGGRKRQMTESKIESAKKLLAKGVPPRDVADDLGVFRPNTLPMGPGIRPGLTYFRYRFLKRPSHSRPSQLRRTGYCCACLAKYTLIISSNFKARARRRSSSFASPTNRSKLALASLPRSTQPGVVSVKEAYTSPRTK